LLGHRRHLLIVQRSDTSVLMGAGLCVDCIIKKTNLPARRVYEALVTIAQALNLESGFARTA